MNLADKGVVVTGASSGIGRAVALDLAARGARLVLVARDAARLEATAVSVRDRGAEAHVVTADLLESEAAAAVARAARDRLGGIDVLVNVAGANSFRPFETEDPGSIERLFGINVIAPMQLARAVLPHMQVRGTGRIVNVGSIFGSIAFPWFATYSATKFALRGFSEALRRELDGTGIGVTYVAPRGTRTPMTAGDFETAAAAAGMHLDDVNDVAGRIVDAIEADDADRYLGFPEKIFVRVNALLPRVVDGALRKPREQLRPHAARTAAPAPRTVVRIPAPRPEEVTP